MLYFNKIRGGVVSSSKCKESHYISFKEGVEKFFGVYSSRGKIRGVIFSMLGNEKSEPKFLVSKFY